MPVPLTNLQQIKQIAEAKETENDAFRVFIKNNDDGRIDAIVHRLNDEITTLVDCTQCGNCCRSLMINVTPGEAAEVAAHLSLGLQEFKTNYIEESTGGQLIMNTIPCHFLTGTKCSIYEQRFNECREFPHLHKNNFSSRLFGMLIHYASCPIIFNVIEKLKVETGFYMGESPPKGDSPI